MRTSDNHTTSSLESKLWRGGGRGTPLGRNQGEVTETGGRMLGWSRQHQEVRAVWARAKRDLKPCELQVEAEVRENPGKPPHQGLGSEMEGGWDARWGPGGLGLLQETVPSLGPAGGGASPKAGGHRLHPHRRLDPPRKHSFPPESLQTCSPSTLFWSWGPGCGRISLSPWECGRMQWGPWNIPFLPEVFGLHKVPPHSDERGRALCWGVKGLGQLPALPLGQQ